MAQLRFESRDHSPCPFHYARFSPGKSQRPVKIPSSQNSAHRGSLGCTYTSPILHCRKCRSCHLRLSPQGIPVPVVRMLSQEPSPSNASFQPNQSEPLLWLCGQAPLNSHRNECLELDSLMHLYWPHQQDDFRRASQPSAHPEWGSRKERITWAKQQEAGALMVWHEKEHFCR